LSLVILTMRTSKWKELLLVFMTTSCVLVKYLFAFLRFLTYLVNVLNCGTKSVVNVYIAKCANSEKGLTYNNLNRALR
jgi:hypothetical protein